MSYTTKAKDKIKLEKEQKYFNNIMNRMTLR